jgi:hypothetical protein
MKKILDPLQSFWTGCVIVSVLFGQPWLTNLQAGGICRPSYYRSYSTSYVKPVVSSSYVNNSFVVNKATHVEFVPTFVSFVPSQVLLNGQVTTYGAVANTAVGYSYQGGYVQQQPSQQQQQPQQQQYLQHNGYQNGQQQQQQQPQYGPQTAPQQGGPPQQQQQNVPHEQLSDNERLKRLEHGVEAILNALSGGSPVKAQQIQVASDFAVCKKCHAPGGGDGYQKLAMFDEQGLLPELPRFDIYTSISKQPGEPGFMPKDHPQLPPEARERIRLWVQEGLRGRSY